MAKVDKDGLLARFPDNTTGDISAADSRAHVTEVADAVNANDDRELAHQQAGSPHSSHLIEVRAGTGILVDNADPQRPLVSATGATGEANAGENVGAGVGWYHGKSGLNLQFRTAVDTATISWTLNGQEVSAQVPANTFDPFGAADAVNTSLTAHKSSGDHDARYASLSHGHDGDEVTIPGGVQGNAVSIDANGNLVDSGTPPGGTGSTNLGNNLTTIDVEITSSSGQDTTIPRATGSLAGCMAAADKTDLSAATTHVSRSDNPHGVTAAQANADPAGSASTVQGNLDTHTGAASPHSGHLIDVTAGAGVAIDKTDPQRPEISATGGVPVDVHLDGYTEDGDTTLATSGTVEIPQDGRIYEIVATGDLNLVWPAALPTLPKIGSAVVFVDNTGGHILSVEAGAYWPGGNAVLTGTILRYVMSHTPSGKKMIDGEEMATA